jgi:hypothetical protein
MPALACKRIALLTPPSDPLHHRRLNHANTKKYKSVQARCQKACGKKSSPSEKSARRQSQADGREKSDG